MSIENLINNISRISLSDNNNLPTMQAAKEIAHTIRPFSGRNEHLESFINSVDKFYNRYGRTTDNSLSEFVFAAICAKIVDEAGDFLLCRPDLDTWPEVKNALRAKYGDRINRHVLQQQLIFLNKNKNENILDFIERIKILKMRLNLKINSDSDLNAAVKESLIAQTEDTALTVLLTNTNAELRTLLMIKNPRTIEEATSLVLNHSIIEQQLTLKQPQSQSARPIQKTPINNSVRQPFNSSQIPQRSFTNNYYTQQAYKQYIPPQAFPKDTQSFPSQPIQINSRPVQRNYPTNAQVFGKPANVFSPQNSRKHQSKPEPMSTTSRIPSLKHNLGPRQNFNNNYNHNNYFKSTGPRNFISEELTNLEVNEEDFSYDNSDYGNFPNEDEYLDYDLDNYPAQQNYTDTENQPLIDSNNHDTSLVDNDRNFQVIAKQIDTS